MNKILLLILATALLTACSNPASQDAGAEEPLQVVATTNILADVVRQVGGATIQVTSVFPEGADPHTYEPAPQDVARIADADLVFQTGFGLEDPLITFLESAGVEARLVSVSDSILPRQFAEGEEPAAEDEHAGEGDFDPHVWFDPNHVSTWTVTIAEALSKADPAHTDTYLKNAQAYQQELAALDTWIRDQVAQVPEANRLIVADHLVFGYFADRYGFRQAGTLSPGYSTMAEPSAQEIAALQDAITGLGVKAVFVGNTANPGLARQVSADTGIKLVLLYTGSLSDSSGEAGTYIDYMRYNVGAIVGALK